MEKEWNSKGHYMHVIDHSVMHRRLTVVKRVLCPSHMQEKEVIRQELMALREDTLRVRREEKEEREDLMAMWLPCEKKYKSGDRSGRRGGKMKEGRP